ncbi:MAG: hypothetical protein WCJ30_28085 [Deltaproteobacteria bacterium]
MRHALLPFAIAVLVTQLPAPAHAQHRVVEVLLTSATTTGPLPQSAAETELRRLLPAMGRCLRAPFRVGSVELHATLTVATTGHVTRVALLARPLPQPAMRGRLVSVLRGMLFVPVFPVPSTLDAVYEVNW